MGDFTLILQAYLGLEDYSTTALEENQPKSQSFMLSLNPKMTLQILSRQTKIEISFVTNSVHCPNGEYLKAITLHLKS